MLRETFERVGTEYLAAKAQPLKGHPLAQFIRTTAAAAIQEALGVTNRDLLAEGSPGAGNWAAVPWIAIFDPVVTESATRGYYPVYLFHTSQPVLHLSMNQGTTQTRGEFGAGTRQILRERAAFTRSRLTDFADLLPVTEISLGSDAGLPGDYAAGHSLGLSYELGRLPSEEVLRRDLVTAIAAYRSLTFRGGLDFLDVDVEGAKDDDLPITLLERRQYRLHRRIERNSTAAKLAKKHHGTRCQVCDLNFAEQYGAIGEGFIEAHHLVRDFAVLCANCHRMIHRMSDPSDLEALRDLIGRSSQ